MVHVGVFVRAEAGQLEAVARRLDALDGVQSFELDTPGAVGAVFEAPNLDAAESRLTREIQQLSGVLCAWPIHTALGEPTPEALPSQDPSTLRRSR